MLRIGIISILRIDTDKHATSASKFTKTYVIQYRSIVVFWLCGDIKHNLGVCVGRQPKQALFLKKALMAHAHGFGHKIRRHESSQALKPVDEAAWEDIGPSKAGIRYTERHHKVR
jgi:hypothetical protein